MVVAGEGAYIDHDFLSVVFGIGSVENDVEVIDLQDEKSSCFKPKDYPFKYGIGGTFINGTAIVCGNADSIRNPPYSCYVYDNTEGER